MAADSSPYLGMPHADERSVKAFDEFRDATGAVRAYQQPLERFLRDHTAAELEQLQKAARWRITEQEVTFNILGVPEGTNRPWNLDVLPYLLDRAEWLELCRGLQQRARLLNEVIADCYGAQRLLRDGLIPAELVLGHPDFLRACHGWEPVSRNRLQLYAADIGRGPDGKFAVYSDRTQAPTGAGYALENRLVMGRTLPDFFREYRVERVAGFFHKVRRAVESLAPRARGSQPRVLLLSAGARDESSFEHAYLARYLGYELVEGRDLTVRDDIVYLKTLSGLRQVDVLLRRVGDAWCDPLMLRAGSSQGVAGLVSAARAGNIGLANALGSVLAETPAFKAYLPRLARTVLGQDLALDSVPTWWCGDRESLSFVLGALDDLIFKPAFGDRQGDPFVPAQMTERERAQFLERLKSRPGDFVAERWPGLSLVPMCGPSGNTTQGGLAWRAFLVRDNDDYDVMPGGLGRINESPDGLFLAIRSNAVSKDVWISSAPGAAAPLLPTMPNARVELRRGGLDLPSRLLDDIYWLGRYVERCDSTARLTRAGIERAASEAGPDAPAALQAILAALRLTGAVPELADSSLTEARPDAPSTPAEAVLLGVLFDTESRGNLRAILRHVHVLTLSVRSRLSRDAWHVLRRLSSSLDVPPSSGEGSGSAIDVLDQLLVTLAAVSGTTLDNMVRGHAWVFLDMGRRVERGALALNQLQALLPAGASRGHMEALLEVADSLLTYRARYLSTLQVAPVVDLLLTDDSNPRSVAFQIEALKGHFRRLPAQGDAVKSRAERRLIALESALLTADIEQACAGDGSGLRQLLEELTALLWQFSDDLSNTWFSHLASSRALSPPAWVNEDLEAK